MLEYQVRQTRRGATISLVCQGDVGVERLRAGIAGGLVGLGIKDPEVQIVQVEHLERLGSGKLKRFIPLDA